MIGTPHARLEAIGHAALVSAAVYLAAVVAAQARPFAPRGWSMAVASSVFLALVVLAAVATRARIFELPRDLLAVASLFLASGFVLLFAAFDVSVAGRLALSSVIAVSYIAWIEESIFRLTLPRWLFRALAPLGSARPRMTWAAATSQVVFAASHFLPGMPRYAWSDVSAPLRLFTGGLLFAVIASRSGLTTVVFVHALLNLRALVTDANLGQGPTPSAMGCISALALLAIAFTPPRSHPVFHPSHSRIHS